MKSKVFYYKRDSEKCLPSSTPKSMRNKALHKIRPEYQKCFTSLSEMPRASISTCIKVSSARMILTYMLFTYTCT